MAGSTCELLLPEKSLLQGVAVWELVVNVGWNLTTGCTIRNKGQRAKVNRVETKPESQGN